MDSDILSAAWPVLARRESKERHWMEKCMVAGLQFDEKAGGMRPKLGCSRKGKKLRLTDV